MDHSHITSVFPQQGETATLKEQQRALYGLLQEFDRICRILNTPYFLYAGTLLGAVRHQGFIPWDDDLDILMLREDYQKFCREAPALCNNELFYVQAEYSDHWPMFFSKLRLNDTACLEKHHPKDNDTHQGLYIDIFPCDNAYNSNLGRKFQFLCSKVIVAQGLDRRGYYTHSITKKLFMIATRFLPGCIFRRIVRGPKKRGEWVHSYLGGASKYSRSTFPARCFGHSVPMQFEAGEYPVPGRYDELLTILYDDYMIIPPEEDRRCKEHSVLVDLKRSWYHYEHYRDGMEFEDPIKSIR